MHISIRLALLALLALAATCALAGPALAQVDEPRTNKPGAAVRKISVSGTAITRIAPDIIVWQISTTDQNKNLLEAKDASDVKLRALLGLREALGIEAKDIQTGHLSIDREYERSRHGNVRTFKQFSVTRRVTVKQRDVKRFDEFLTRFVTAADVEVDFSLESSRFHELRMRTRLDALKVARTKAEAMAGILGAKLGPVLTISEAEQASPYWNTMSNSAVNMRGPAQADAQSGTFAPGAIEIRVSVAVAFTLQ